MLNLNLTFVDRNSSLSLSDRPEAEFLPPAGAGDSGAVSTGTKKQKN